MTKYALWKTKQILYRKKNGEFDYTKRILLKQNKNIQQKRNP